MIGRLCNRSNAISRPVLMRRGLDGFSCFSPGIVRFSSSTGAVSNLFGGEIARGKHLFPFRTEPLSLSAPMVLGGQPPGRVGRRRSFTKAALGGGFRRSGPPRRGVLALALARGHFLGVSFQLKECNSKSRLSTPLPLRVFPTLPFPSIPASGVTSSV